MHGIRRVDPSQVTEAQRAEKRKKIAKYVAMRDDVLAMRKDRRHDKEALALTRQVLEINPELYSLWNYRREILLGMMDKRSCDVAELLADELNVVGRAIQRNPKSYVSWHHRLWVVQRGGSDILKEIDLTSQFLMADARNFHCWDYRRSLVDLSNVSPSEELEFTRKKINDDFSNYSAWHYRSTLLTKIGIDQEVLDREFALVADCFFTEPDDQSAWLYHRWLCVQHPDIACLEKQLSIMDELLDLEPNCKWALLTSVRLLSELCRLDRTRSVPKRRIGDIFNRLPVLDPQRKTYYRDLCDRICVQLGPCIE
ncbi:Geranylgeranyl transferase type-2 subunit alpha [Plasmodiophora brassicae]|uniref:Geranylgeranyl transferase type-2 subunit alpha n=1 Tax=Plasmodiophora brassicae TaxID=37360 RepID=A0A0G4J6T3_PLABS|nr:hypothetical protein PBRA_003030 [Plasmodiophora brassicae]